VYGFKDFGDDISSAVSSIAHWFSSLFHGGENHLTAQQQKYSQAGLLNTQNLQGVPGTVPYSDLRNGWFNVDTVSGSQGPQVTTLAQITVTGQYMGPGALTTPPPDLTLMVEPPTAIHNFGVQTAQGLSGMAAGQAQSANYPSEIASTPSYWSIVGQSTARSAPKALNVVLIAASFIPIADIAADAALAARGLGWQNSLFRSALRPYNAESGLSNAGRALTKHPELVGATKATLRQSLSTDAALNGAAQAQLKDIIRNGVLTNPSMGRYGEVIQMQIPGGFGARWYPNGKFIGFINP